MRANNGTYFTKKEREYFSRLVVAHWGQAILTVLALVRTVDAWHNADTTHQEVQKGELHRGRLLHGVLVRSWQ
jgi:hypothetical protein